MCPSSAPLESDATAVGGSAVRFMVELWRVVLRFYTCELVVERLRNRVTGLSSSTRFNTTEKEVAWPVEDPREARDRALSAY